MEPDFKETHGNSVFDDSDEDHLFTRHEDEFEIVDEESTEEVLDDDGMFDLETSRKTP